jgi:hypothetical protein
VPFQTRLTSSRLPKKVYWHGRPEPDYLPPLVLLVKIAWIEVPPLRCEQLPTAEHVTIFNIGPSILSIITEGMTVAGTPVPIHFDHQPYVMPSSLSSSGRPTSSPYSTLFPPLYSNVTWPIVEWRFPRPEANSEQLASRMQASIHAHIVSPS